MTPADFAYVRTLASGHRVVVAEDGKAQFFTCSWLVEVPTFCPEPDFPGDLFTIEECGARTLSLGIGTEGWECEAGHSYRGIEVEWALDYERECEERRFAS